MFVVQMTSFASDTAWTESLFVNRFQPLVSFITEKVQPGLGDLKHKMHQEIQKTGVQMQPNSE